MDQWFLCALNSLLVFLAVAGTPTSTVPGSSVDSPRSASPEAAEYLRSAMFQFRPDPHLTFSSKADFTSPEDNIEAGVVREGPEPTVMDDLDSSISTAMLNRIQVGYDHARHAQMIESQHKTPYEERHPVYQAPQPRVPPALRDSYGHVQANPMTEYRQSHPQPQANYGQSQAPPPTDYGKSQAQPPTDYGKSQAQPPTGYGQSQDHPPMDYELSEPPEGYEQSQAHLAAEYHFQQPPVQQQPQQHPQQHPPAMNHAQPESAPPPISKEELHALYKAALQKGSHLNLSQLPPNAEGLGEPNVGTMPGYYYYYYPIKQLPKPGENGDGDGKDKGQEGDGNGDGNGDGDGNGMENTNGQTKVEPLFVAMSAFIGVSMAFMFSLLFLPKIGFLRSNGIGLLSRLAPDDLTALTRVVFESIDGKDCDLRIACELGRVLRKFHLHDKPIKFLESYVSKEAKVQLQNVRRAGIYRPKCGVIKCKRRQRSA